MLKKFIYLKLGDKLPPIAMYHDVKYKLKNSENKSINDGGLIMPDCSCRNIMDYHCEVLRSEKLSDKIYWLTVKCPELASKAVPGNCIMVYISDGLEPLLGRPFAVVDADMDRGELSVCYIMQGHGTELLSGLKLGSFVKVRGLLGVPLPVSGKKIYLTGGGVGIAIFMLYNKIYRENVAGLYLGIPGRGSEKYAQEILHHAADAKIFTDDGSFGDGDSMFKALPKELGENEEIWACGPPGFIKAVKSKYSSQLDKVLLALEKRMACGYGGCMGCTIETKDGMKRLCVDQSLFRADEVNPDED